MNNEIIFFALDNSVAYTSLSRLNYKVISPYARSRRKDYRTRYILHRLKLENLCLFNYLYTINAEIKRYNPSIIVIIGSLIYEPFIKNIRTMFPHAIVKYSYNNIVNSTASIEPSVLKKYDVGGYSWDKNDCCKYNLTYQTPGYDPNNLIIDNNNYLYDAAFIGADKGRKKILSILANFLRSKGYVTYIHIVPDNRAMTFIQTGYKSRISYTDYIYIISHSKCLIDIVQQNQVGTTLRVMEAVFSSKKIITNNLLLQNYDFYHPQNIFILRDDNMSEIPKFLELPYRTIDPKILSKYRFKESIMELLNK